MGVRRSSTYRCTHRSNATSACPRRRASSRCRKSGSRRSGAAAVGVPGARPQQIPHGPGLAPQNGPAAPIGLVGKGVDGPPGGRPHIAPHPRGRRKPHRQRQLHEQPEGLLERTPGPCHGLGERHELPRVARVRHRMTGGQQVMAHALRHLDPHRRAPQVRRAVALPDPARIGQPDHRRIVGAGLCEADPQRHREVVVEAQPRVLHAQRRLRVERPRGPAAPGPPVPDLDLHQLPRQPLEHEPLGLGAAPVVPLVPLIVLPGLGHRRFLRTDVRMRTECMRSAYGTGAARYRRRGSGHSDSSRHVHI